MSEADPSGLSETDYSAAEEKKEVFGDRMRWQYKFDVLVLSNE